MRTPRGIHAIPFLFLGLVQTLAAASTQDAAVISVLQRHAPAATNAAVIRRLAVDEELELALALGKSQPFTAAGDGSYWWTREDRLGLFLQDRKNAGRVYALAVEPGPNDDCSIRIERMTAQDLVLSCTGEKWATYENQKFVYDVRAKGLVKHFSYRPFQSSRVVQTAKGPQFVMSDTQQLLLVAVDPESHNLTVVPEAAARPVLSRIPMQEHAAGDQTFKGFRLAGDTIAGSQGKSYPLPQSSPQTWRAARPDDLQSGLRPDQAKIHEEIGPHQIEGNRLWFGKTFYNSEGATGVGGFGYFDSESRSYRMHSPPEIERWSVSSILVEPDTVWLALYRRGEWGNNPGGVLAWDRRTEAIRRFDAGTIALNMVRQGGSLYLGAVDGIVVLRDRKISSYFVDRTTGGRYRVALREGALR